MRAILVLLAAIALALWHFLSSRPVEHAPGVIAPEEPKQEVVEATQKIDDREFTLQTRAHFNATVRVLAREDYSMGKLAGIAPVDFAVGWGRMSDSAILAKLEISQGNRFYYWHYEGDPPLPRDEIESHSANWHMIPASETVTRSLKDVRVGSVVHLQGLLVDVSNPDMGVIHTSLTRSDTGPGACEILYLQSVDIRTD